MQVSQGFSNWKDATLSLCTHQDSACHKEAHEKIFTIPATTRNIGDLLSAVHAKEKADNQHCLLKILSCLSPAGMWNLRVWR